MQSCFCLIPLSTPPKPSAERTLGTTLHSRTSKAKQSSSGPQERLGAPIPNWRKQTLSLPTRQRGNRGARCQNRVRAHTHVHPQAWTGTGRAASMAALSLLQPRLFCLTCLGARSLSPRCCPKLPHLLHWALCGREEQAGRAVGQTPDSLSCFWAGPSHIGQCL